MKLISFLALFISVSFTVYAQTLLISPENFTAPVYEMPYFSSLSIKPLYKITKEVNEGSIYTSPLDKMPCAIPYLSYVGKMPVYKSYLPNREMPNPFTKTPVFPTLVIKQNPPVIK